MTRFPRLSEGLLVATLGDEVIVYDLISETRHRCNSAAGAVLNACGGATSIEVVAAEWSNTSGTAVATVVEQVHGVLRSLSALGLVDRSEMWTAPLPPVAASTSDDATRWYGGVHLVLDQSIQICGPDKKLIERVDAYLGTSASDVPAQCAEASADLVFEVTPLEGDRVRFVTDHEEVDEDVDTLLLRLVSVTNEYAVRSHGCLGLHAAALRSPTGSIILLPGPSGAGKSTLAAALVAAGWDYLGDEVIGIDARGRALGYPKRLALDPAGRALLGLSASPDGNADPAEIRPRAQRLGGVVGRISGVVFPTYEPGAGCALTELSVQDRFDALLSNTLNLARIGQAGLEALCLLADDVHAFRLVHGDAIGAVGAIAEAFDIAPAGDAAIPSP